MRRAFVFLVLALSGLAAAAVARAGTVLEDLRAPSPALGGEIAYSLYLPDGIVEGERLPTLYLLHGYNGGQREWLKGGRLEALLDRLIGEGSLPPLIAVMPQGGKSWYVDSAAFGGPGDYETAIVRDLMAEVERRFPSAGERALRGIAGNSMGGFGALRLAFRHNDLFSAVVGLSPGIYKHDGRSWAQGLPSEWNQKREQWFPRTTGETFDKATYVAQSPFADVERVAVMPEPPRILLMVGDDDYFRLYEGTIELFLDLRDAEVAAELRVGDGAHDWKYWRRTLPEALRFLAAEWPGSAETQ